MEGLLGLIEDDFGCSSSLNTAEQQAEIQQLKKTAEHQSRKEKKRRKKKEKLEKLEKEKEQQLKVYQAQQRDEEMCEAAIALNNEKKRGREEEKEKKRARRELKRNRHTHTHLLPPHPVPSANLALVEGKMDPQPALKRRCTANVPPPTVTPQRRVPFEAICEQRDVLTLFARYLLPADLFQVWC